MSLRSCGQNVEDMWLAMNAESCGDFDDVILCKKVVGCPRKTYIMQLKHQDNPRNIVRDQFLSDKGNYSLKKYENSLCDMHSKIKGTDCREKCEILDYLRKNSDVGVVPILFTNNAITKYPFLKETNSSNVALLNTDKGSVFKFSYKDLGYTPQTTVQGYFENMYLFTNQVGIAKINSLIETAIKALTTPLEISHENLNKIVQKYATFITEWGSGLLGGHYALTKTHVLRKLAELLLEPYMSKFYEAHRLLNNKFRTKIWGEIMEEQDVTIIDSDNTVTQFLLEYVIHTTTKCEEARQDEQDFRKVMMRCVSVHEKYTYFNDYEYLWKSRKMPLILEAATSKSCDIIVAILKAFKGTFKVILLKNSEISVSEIRNMKVFRTINDLSSDKVQNILKADIKLQGRPGAKLLELLHNKVEHLNLLTSKDTISILSNTFNIGNVLNKLPDLFIERFVAKILLQPKILQATTKDLFVISCKSSKTFQMFVQKQHLHLPDLNLHDSDKLEVTTGNPLLVTTADTVLELKALESPTKKGVHQLILHDTQELEWVRSLGSTETIRTFRLISERTNLKPIAVINAEVFYSNRIKLVSAGPGMGKSVLLDYVALKTPPSTWVLSIHLKDYLDYYHSDKFRSSVASDHLKYFNDCVLRNSKWNTSLAKAVFRELLTSKRVLLLLDGFDEIAVGFKREVTKLVLTLYKQGFSMWLTTRPVMREHTEDAFDVLSVTLNPFSKEDQFTYITKYYGVLNSDNVPNKSELIDEFVTQLLDVAGRNINDFDNRFIGIPLHTKLLALVFRPKCLSYINTSTFTLNRNFDLISLYEAFVKEKVQIFHAKYGKFFGDACDQYERYQQFLALRTLFGDENAEGLKIKEKLYRFIDVMTLQLAQADAIVVPIDELDITFAHRTYAEYLAARWLAENFMHAENRPISQYLILKLFEPSYSNVKNLFDKILGRNCDAHCLVLNSNYQRGQVEPAIKRYPDAIDKGGRSVLHLMATRGVVHPIPITTDLKFIKNSIDVSKEIQIPEVLFRNINIVDKVLGFTPLDYAVESRCLGVVDVLCTKSEGLIVDVSEDHLSFYLYYCAMFNYRSLLEAILKRYQTIVGLKDALNTVIQAYETPLHCATTKRRSIVVKLLLSYGAHANIKDFNGKSPLHIAAENGFDDIALLLLEFGACIDRKDSVWFTPLHRAALNGHADIVTLLLSSSSLFNDKANYYENYEVYTTKNPVFNKANLKMYVNNTDKEKNTALHFSAMNGYTTIVSLLLCNGTDVNLPNSRGYTALHLASCKGHISTVFVILANSFVNVNATTKIFADVTSYVSNTDPVYEDILYPSNLGTTALHEAAKGGYDVIVSLLLSSGAKPNLKNDRTFTALHEAARSGHKEVVSALLDNGADVTIANNRGCTALHEAARWGRTGVVSLLLPKTSDINQMDNGGYTALHEAAWKGHSEVVLMLLSNKTCDVNAKSKRSTTSLYLAAKHGHRNVVSLLLSKSAQVNVQNNLGVTALHKAAQGGHRDIVSMLLSHAANINLADSQARTPLYVACMAGHANVVSFLLAKGARTENVTKNGMTVLHEASYYGDVNVVSEILIYKARVNVKDSVGKTPLHHAVSGKQLLVVKELAKNGADVSLRDLDSNSPLDLAKKLGYLEIESYLRKLQKTHCGDQINT